MLVDLTCDSVLQLPVYFRMERSSLLWKGVCVRCGTQPSTHVCEGFHLRATPQRLHLSVPIGHGWAVLPARSDILGPTPLPSFLHPSLPPFLPSLLPFFLPHCNCSEKQPFISLVAHVFFSPLLGTCRRWVERVRNSRLNHPSFLYWATCSCPVTDASQLRDMASTLSHPA